MAQFEIVVRSKEVGERIPLTIILPTFDGFDDAMEEGIKFQTLWLLHGTGGDHQDYVHKTNIEHLAVKHNLAVVMPSVGNCSYANMTDGRNYFNFVTDELPRMLRRFLPLSDKREDNFIAGLSMGGGGAAKIAFNYPERYAAVAIMSAGPGKVNSPIRGGLDSEMMRKRRLLVHGDRDLTNTTEDTYYMIKKDIAEGKELPMIYSCCGTEDFLWPKYCEFKEFAAEIGLDVTFDEMPGGHEWDFWGAQIYKIMDWLPLKTRNWRSKVLSEGYDSQSIIRFDK